MKHYIPRDSFNRILLFVAAFAILFAFLDSIGADMWGALGGWESEVYKTAFPFYMQQFWTFAYAMIGVAAVIYYSLTKDWSETLAIVIAGVASVWGGIEDLAFYIIRGIPLEGNMDWLINTQVGTVARFLGHTTVTSFTLILNIIFYSIVAYFLINWLYKQKW